MEHQHCSPHSLLVCSGFVQSLEGCRLHFQPELQQTHSPSTEKGCSTISLLIGSLKLLLASLDKHVILGLMPCYSQIWSQLCCNAPTQPELHQTMTKEHRPAILAIICDQRYIYTNPNDTYTLIINSQLTFKHLCRAVHFLNESVKSISKSCLHLYIHTLYVHIYIH